MKGGMLARARWWVLAGIGLMVGGCAGVQVSSGPSSNLVYPSLDQESLRSATYPCDQAAAGKVTLRAGTYSEPLGMGSPDQLVVTLLSQWSAFGDLDGDGNKDAAAILTVRAHGASVLYYLVTMLNANGTPVAQASLLLGDRIKLYSLTIAAEKILINVYRQGPGDQMSNPKQRFKEVYKLEGQDLTRISQTQLAQ